MFLFTLYRLYGLFTAFVAEPLTFYARLVISKVLPEKPESRWQLQRGQGLVEYALVLVLVAVVVIAVLTLLGPRVGAIFFRIQCSFQGGEIYDSVSFPGRLDCVNPSASKFIFGDVIGFYEPDGNFEWAE